MRVAIITLLTLALISGAGYMAYEATTWEIHYDSIAGRVAFDAEEDYSDFKRQMAQDSITTIEKWDVYESRLPIVVDFKVRAEDDAEFSYGAREEVDHDEDLFAAIAFPLIILLLGTLSIGLVNDVLKQELRG